MKQIPNEYTWWQGTSLEITQQLKTTAAELPLDLTQLTHVSHLNRIPLAE